MSSRVVHSKMSLAQAEEEEEMEGVDKITKR